MMLHRHFEEDKKKKQREANGEFVSEIFANSEDEKPEQPKRGRRKKSED